MPAGVDWFPYLRVLFASFLSAAAGAQAVHMYYKPDLSIPETPPERGELPQLRRMLQKQPQEGSKDLPPESEDANVEKAHQPAAEL